jgi:ABC-2 type transport system permease protein
MIGAMALAALTFSTIGVGFACRFSSTTVFPIVSNAVLLPMFFLSGGLYRSGIAPPGCRLPPTSTRSPTRST